MTPTDIAGTVAMFVSLSITLFGLPRQIYKNWRRKSCEGLDPGLVGVVLIAYLAWATYSILKPDIYLAVSQTAGAIFTSIIALQFYWYRKRRPFARE